MLFTIKFARETGPHLLCQCGHASGRQNLYFDSLRSTNKAAVAIISKFAKQIGSISAAVLCLVYPPREEFEFGGGARAPFPNSGW